MVVFTKQLEDRSRKIMEIIEGEDYIDGKLAYRSLYKYHVEDNVADSNGNTRVLGHHQKAEAISDSLQKRLLDNGIPHKELEEFLRPDTTGQKAVSLQVEPLAHKTEMLQAEPAGQKTAPLQAEPLEQKAAPKTASTRKPAGKKPKGAASDKGESPKAMAAQTDTGNVSNENAEYGIISGKGGSDSITAAEADPNSILSTEAKLAEYISEKYIPEKPVPARTGGTKTAPVRRIRGKVSPVEEKQPDKERPAEAEPAIPILDTSTDTDTPKPPENNRTLNESHDKKGG